MNDSTAHTIARAARYGITLSLAAGFGLAPLAQAQDRSVDTPCPPLSGDLDPAGKFVWMYSVGNTSFDPDKITTLNSQMY